jgi:hypothetical protein
MRGFTSISRPFTATLTLLLALGLAGPRLAGADGPGPGDSKPKVDKPEEDDFTNTPFTEYGEFNEEADEEADAKFFAHGRFFGVSLGIGFEGVTGNRGLLYQGGFPMIDGKLHYWFDFNFAVDIDLYYAKHFYDTTDSNGGHVDVSMIHAGIDGKYYFDTKNLSSAISFANPFIEVGFGAYSQSKSSFVQAATEPPDTAVGMSLGGGLEFVLSPKKAYLELEGRYHIVTFSDQYSTDFQSSNNVSDLTGGFYTFSANVLFTW